MNEKDNGRYYLAMGMGLVGGLAAASWGVQHMFVEGVTDEERQSMMKLGLGITGVAAAVYLFDLDKRWLSLEGGAEIIQEKLIQEKLISKP